MSAPAGHVIALSGGIGGAKLALGLSRVLPPDRLTVFANTGDDFEHLGFSISPDLDTLMYVLAGLDDPVRGWGRRDETWNFMAALSDVGGEIWFQLGDRDLATHVERTRRLAAGETLSQATAALCGRLGVPVRLLPMSDNPVRTRLLTAEGWLDFQDWFVRLRCEPAVSQIAFAGAEQARPHPDLMAALADPALAAVVICPSNPLISVEPILAMPGVRDALAACAAPVVAVSPIIAGQAVKGPTAKMLRELGLEPGAAAVAERYRGLVDVFVVETGDEAIAIPGLQVVPAATLMRTLEDRDALARTVLAAAAGWTASKGRGA